MRSVGLLERSNVAMGQEETFAANARSLRRMLSGALNGAAAK